MAKKVLLTKSAAIDYENIIDYLINDWSIEVALNFAERFDEVLISLSVEPGRFPYFDKIKQVQRCIVTKHNILYFQETADFVKVITVFDTRQNPERLTSFI